MKVEALLSAIRDGDRHAGGIRCHRVLGVQPAAFAALRSEVLALCEQQHPSDVARPDHVTHWTRPFGEVLQYSLYNASGRADDFSTDHDLSCFGKRFGAAADHPALAELLARFVHATNVRLNLLGPGAGLSPHEEHVLVRMRDGTIGARVRFHLPIVTNPGAELVLDGHVHHLEAGTIHFVNHGCVHAAANHGDAVRIHLAWDMLLTSETFALMFGDDPVEPPLVRIPDADREPEVLRLERLAAPRRLPPLVSPTEAARLALCRVQ